MPVSDGRDHLNILWGDIFFISVFLEFINIGPYWGGGDKSIIDRHLICDTVTHKLRYIKSLLL
jgi:hypothetical protein